MFQKRSIELFAFLVYWFGIFLLVHKFAQKRAWLHTDIGQLSDFFTRYSVFLAIMIIGYLTFYRFTLVIYANCKKMDVEMFEELRAAQKEAELGSNSTTNTLNSRYPSLSSVDEIDGSRNILNRADSENITGPIDKALIPRSTKKLYNHSKRAKSNSAFMSDLELSGPDKRKKFNVNSGISLPNIPSVHSMKNIAYEQPRQYCIRKPAPQPPMQQENNYSVQIKPPIGFTYGGM